MNTDVIDYNDDNLQALYAAMSPKERRKALRGGVTQCANAVLSTARANLRSSGLRADGDMERCVRRTVFTRVPGFSVTVAPGKRDVRRRGVRIEGMAEGMYMNRRGAIKPVAFWAELGTLERSTKTRTRVFTRKRRGHRTGRMPKYGFMERTLSQQSASMTERMQSSLRDYTLKTAKRYGCIV